MADEGAGVQEAKVPERVVDGKPTLYCFETCPFCWKVRSLLSWKGVDFSKVEVDPMKKKELKWSDWSAVPVYVEADGTQVNDSNPILHWVNSNHTGGTPFPRAGEDESQDKWMDFSGDVLGKSIVAVIYSSYGDSRKALAYVSEVESFSRWQAFQAKWLGGVIMRMVGKSRAKMFELPPEENLEFQLDHLSSALAGDFMGGEVPNGADFANYGILRAMQGLRGFPIVEAHGSIGPWFQRMKSTSGV